MAGTGGKRAGAGRPKGTKSILSKEFVGRLLVEGNAVQKFKDLMNSESQKIVLETLKYLCDHLWGKAPQAMTISNPDGSNVVIGLEVINVGKPE